MKKENKTTIVLGQRRSGTSMLAGVLNKLGVYMGENPERKSEKNPIGFFEDEEIVALSRKIMDSVINKGYTKAGVEREFGSEISSLFRKRDKEHSVWGFKDVNQVQTHFVFRKKIKNPKYFVIFRNPLDVAMSLNSWHGTDFLKALETVTENDSMLFQYMVATLAGDPIVALSYEKMLVEPEETIETIIDFLEIEPTDEQKTEAVKHIKPELNHYGRE